MKEYEKAAGCFEKTVELDKTYHIGYHNLGLTYKNLKQMIKAR